MLESLRNLVIIVGPAIARSVFGWAKVALKDNKVTRFEWKQLVTTVIRVGAIGIATFYGLNSAGVDISALGAGMASFIADICFKSMKERKVIRN